MSLEAWLGQRRPAWQRLEAILDRLQRRGTAPDCGGRDSRVDRAVSGRLRRLGPAAGVKRRSVAGRPAEPPGDSRPRPNLSRRSAALVEVGPIFLRSTIRGCFGRHGNSPPLVSFSRRPAPDGLLDRAELAAVGGRYSRRRRIGILRPQVRGRHPRAFRPRGAIRSFPAWSSPTTSEWPWPPSRLGITFGVGTVYMMIFNGAMVGGIAGAFAKSGIGWQFWMVILPHGALELSAVVIAGGAGLMMGYGLWCPGQRTRRRALREEVVRAMQLGRRTRAGLRRRRNVRGPRHAQRRHTAIAQGRPRRVRSDRLLAVPVAGGTGNAGGKVNSLA